jgi:hypothetical protein
VLCSANVALFLVWWLTGVLKPEIFSRLDKFTYPPSLLIVFVPILLLLPWYVVAREDSGHWIAYVFSYMLLLVLATQNLQLLWLLMHG